MLDCIFLFKLAFAILIFYSSAKNRDPNPLSELVIKETKPKSNVRMFQDDDHSSL